MDAMSSSCLESTESLVGSSVSPRAILFFPPRKIFCGSNSIRKRDFHDFFEKHGEVSVVGEWRPAHAYAK